MYRHKEAMTFIVSVTMYLFFLTPARGDQSHQNTLLTYNHSPAYTAPQQQLPPLSNSYSESPSYSQSYGEPSSYADDTDSNTFNLSLIFIPLLVVAGIALLFPASTVLQVRRKRDGTGKKINIEKLEICF